MLPLKLCWAWTNWNNQGMIIQNKIVAYFTTKEANHRIMYIMLSYIYEFSNIKIKGSIEKC